MKHEEEKPERKNRKSESEREKMQKKNKRKRKDYISIANYIILSLKEKALLLCIRKKVK